MCIKFCGAFELALRAHGETSTTDNPGIYVGLVNFTAEIDALLAIHYEMLASIQRYIKNYSERIIRGWSSPSQILTTKLLTFVPPRNQGEWILCRKNRRNFLCPPSFKAYEPSLQ
nr:unnamed protein product [Callosobruchus analis]